MPRTTALSLGWFFCLLTGCSGPASRVPAPALSPEAAAKQALALYDTNGDGYLDKKELERCPGLKSCLSKLDKDGDGRLSAKEIADRLALYQESRIGLLSISCQVLIDSHPLAGATVTFVPEDFLGPGIKSASGVSDDNGRVVLQAEAAEMPGLQCGFYRVVVSKKSGAGKEMIPAKYNQQTTLGHEIGPDMRGGITLRVTSR